MSGDNDGGWWLWIVLGLLVLAALDSGAHAASGSGDRPADLYPDTCFEAPYGTREC